MNEEAEGALPTKFATALPTHCDEMQARMAWTGNGLEQCSFIESCVEGMKICYLQHITVHAVVAQIEIQLAYSLKRRVV